MSHFEKLVLTLCIIFISLLAGYLCRQLASRRVLPVSETFLAALRVRLQSVAIFILIPFSAILSLWGLPQPDSELLILPLLGLFSYIIGGAMAVLAGKIAHMTPAQTGSFFCCGTFDNIGAIGGLVCLVFLGENSIALVALYRLLEEIYYFGVSFPIAKKFASVQSQKHSAYLKSRFNPLPIIIVMALALGIFLNLQKVERAPFLGNLASMSMLLATVFFLFAIGLSLKISSIGSYIRPGLVMCAIKFMAVPACIVMLARLLGCDSFDNGLALKVVAILSAMPVAMTALVPPSLFDLDLDLANACWIMTTLGLVIVLPALMFILPVL